MILDVATAARLLEQGGVVGMPTETVYGLAGNALHAKAVLRIFEAKQRPFFDPLIVHVHSIEQVEQLTKNIPDVAMSLMNAFWPGPLSLVLPRSNMVPDIITAGLETVAIRMPAHPVALELLRTCGFPLAAPSANLFGRLSPTTADAVLEQLQGRIDGVIDGGACSVGVESTIIGWWQEQWTMLRPGGLARERIEQITGPLQSLAKISDKPNQGIPAPGNLPSHYAPRTPLSILPSEIRPIHIEGSKQMGLLAFGELSQEEAAQWGRVAQLSSTSNADEAALNLYAHMRQLDSANLQKIIAMPVAGHGIAEAVMDRLQKAQGNRQF